VEAKLTVVFRFLEVLCHLQKKGAGLAAHAGKSVKIDNFSPAMGKISLCFYKKFLLGKLAVDFVV